MKAHLVRSTEHILRSEEVGVDLDTTKCLPQLDPYYLKQKETTDFL